MKTAAFGLAAGLALGVAGAALADDLAAEQRFGETAVTFDIKGNVSNVTLSLSGPNGFHASASAKTGSPTIDLRRFGAPDDGVYRYQLTASGGEKLIVRTQLDDGRGGSNAPLKTVTASGNFTVKGGVIVKPSSAPQSRKDQQ